MSMIFVQFLSDEDQHVSYPGGRKLEADEGILHAKLWFLNKVNISSFSTKKKKSNEIWFQFLAVDTFS
uniref:Uncharacterized protein n=1 Tax=Musa acuminata subsp. malaccensis TaxID=214687 RepID=A0A804L7D1_MUSAM